MGSEKETNQNTKVEKKKDTIQFYKDKKISIC